MPKYIVSTCYFFRETGLRHEAGDEIELTEEEAKKHNEVHIGLLKAKRITTQGNPKKVIRKRATRKRTSM